MLKLAAVLIFQVLTPYHLRANSVESFRKQLEQVQSFEVKSTSVGNVIHDPKSEAKGRVWTINFSHSFNEEGEKIALKRTDAEGIVKEDFIYAFDSNRSYFLDGEKKLMISSGETLRAHPLILLYHPLIRPMGSAHIGEKSVNAFIPRMISKNASVYLESVLFDAKFDIDGQGFTVLTKNVFSETSKKKKFQQEMRWEGKPMPSQWKRFEFVGGVKLVASSFEVVEWESRGENAYWPKKSIERYFNEKGEVLTEISHTISSLEINKKFDSQDDFTIDPSLAKEIYDADSKTFISVPSS